MADDTQRLTEAVERARASVMNARAKLDGVMSDVRALPLAYKTSVCQIIEHVFDELLVAERELAQALDARSDAATHEGAPEAPRPDRP
ncbi:MAG TPA: hypothetical protein VFS43_47195 [Polyangiaceae bacterium]|nr:hypothetical protein [Polyangiaceae bacterium]